MYQKINMKLFIENFKKHIVLLYVIRKIIMNNKANNKKSVFDI